VIFETISCKRWLTKTSPLDIFMSNKNDSKIIKKKKKKPLYRINNYLISRNLPTLWTLWFSKSYLFPSTFIILIIQIHKIHTDDKCYIIRIKNAAGEINCLLSQGNIVDLDFNIFNKLHTCVLCGHLFTACEFCPLILDSSINLPQILNRFTYHTLHRNYVTTELFHL
jgi:hypothetical protein